MLSSQVTSIGEAIRLSKNYYDDDNQTNRVLCIISDGEDHESQNINVSSIVGDTGITIFTIGVGSTSGAPIPIKEKNIINNHTLRLVKHRHDPSYYTENMHTHKRIRACRQLSKLRTQAGPDQLWLAPGADEEVKFECTWQPDFVITATKELSDESREVGWID